MQLVRKKNEKKGLDEWRMYKINIMFSMVSDTAICQIFQPYHTGLEVCRPYQTVPNYQLYQFVCTGMGVNI